MGSEDRFYEAQNRNDYKTRAETAKHERDMAADLANTLLERVDEAEASLEATKEALREALRVSWDRAATIARVEALVQPGWHTNNGHKFETHMEAYAAGQNAFIDKVRAALNGDDA